MKIIRNGQEFELSKDELFKAYKEQQALFDTQIINDNMEKYLDKTEYAALKNNQSFIEETASELRRNQDKYDMDYEYAIRKAFETTKLTYLN